jgi:hypothetical protein
MTQHTWLVVLFLLAGMGGRLIYSDEGERIAIGWQRLVLDNIPREVAPRLSASAWQRECERVLQQGLPHCRIGQAGMGCRYFGIARLQEVAFWAVTQEARQESTALLARVALRLFIYDLAAQREILRDHCYGYASVPGSHLDTGLAHSLLEQAFSQSLDECVRRIALHLPPQGKVQSIEPSRRTNTTIASVAIGSRHGVQRDDVVEILEQGNSRGLFQVLALQPEECKVFHDGYVHTAGRDLVARLIQRVEFKKAELREGENLALTLGPGPYRKTAIYLREPASWWESPYFWSVALAVMVGGGIWSRRRSRWASPSVAPVTSAPVAPPVSPVSVQIQVPAREAPPNAPPQLPTHRSLTLHWQGEQGERSVKIFAGTTLRLGRGLNPKPEVELPLFADPVIPLPPDNGPLSKECQAQPTLRLSGCQALICYQHGRFVISDQNSANGTVVNGNRLKPDEPCPLADGDKLSLANVCHFTLAICADSSTLRLQRRLGRAHETYFLLAVPPDTELAAALEIGSDSECGFCLPLPGVAPRHARLTLRAGRFTWQRCAPTADLRWNGQPVACEAATTCATGPGVLTLGTLRLQGTVA